MERIPGGPARSTGSHRSHRLAHRPAHRQRKPIRGRLTVVAGTAAAAAGLGIAVAVGAMSSGPARPVAAAMAVPSSAAESPLQASASPLGSYALARMPTPTPSVTATPTQKAPPTPVTADSGLLTPQPTAEYETPRGENQKAWSEAILTALDAPLTSANILSIGYWMQNEAGQPPYGIVGANNPINVSQPCCGGVPIRSDGDGVTFLRSYRTVGDGVEAIREYLERGNYTQIVANLRAGVGLITDPNLAPEISLYSGGNYSTIPDSFGASQGAPLS